MTGRVNRLAGHGGGSSDSRQVCRCAELGLSTGILRAIAQGGCAFEPEAFTLIREQAPSDFQRPDGAPDG
jgi:hypothetical protein